LTRYARETITKGIDDQFQACEDNGMVVTRLTDEQRQVWADACRGTYEKMSEEIGPDIIAQVETLLNQ
jgi:TRAP-type C4-dicarboxylate transport system substrate-binding protein